MTRSVPDTHGDGPLDDDVQGRPPDGERGPAGPHRELPGVHIGDVGSPHGDHHRQNEGTGATGGGFVGNAMDQQHPHGKKLNRCEACLVRCPQEGHAEWIPEMPRTVNNGHVMRLIGTLYTEAAPMEVEKKEEASALGEASHSTPPLQAAGTRAVV